ncbi:superinfection immunity protein [Glaciecola sp. 1036]|uniref:superinfection immunity protein n=1 Tax=Alteromonadaceae TaxID=72275 RepID=UPI003D06BA07
METIQQFFTAISTAWQQADFAFLVLFTLFFLVVWFLPSLLALAFNRQHAGKIALLNIPAIFSWVAWVALLVWAVTGKLSTKLATKAKFKPQYE